ncbi:MAG: SDR family NAD(P)-dependent oxidoreductase [Burkholderiaceae bacterium]|nr:SDR family NAD(P)-dependent oxidoreductase [Burkholderiaceae bacterium]
MSWTLKQAPTQSGRIAVITGANIGLGFETALALAGKGCAVVLACRNTAKAEAAQAAILAQHPKARVESMALDLGSLKSVRSFAAAYKKRHATLDLLINNAGIMMPPFSLSEDGFESQLAANYLGHFALTGLLLPRIVKTPNARVVSLSSLAHKWSGIRFHDLNARQRYDKRLAYGQSKLACLMFAYELQRRLARAGHTTLSVAAHPGVSATNLFQHLPKVVQLFAPLTELVFQSASGGAQPTLYAALGDDIRGGDYCGPQSMGEMRGAPGKVGSSRRSRDEAVAARLWTVSEEMTGLRFLD